jgi:glucose/arabinose dehydrogenase
LIESRYLLLLVIIPTILAIFFTIYSLNPTYASLNSDLSSKLTFACLKVGPTVRCDPNTNKFDSAILSGHAQRISTLNSTQIDANQGVFGNAVGILGYRQQYLTIPSQSDINPAKFSLSFWIKQDPAVRGNTSVISHVNSAKTSGWYVDHYVNNSQSFIRFSLTNSDGRQFHVTTSIEPGIFQNIVGVFDGNAIMIYLNGFLEDTAVFTGDYDPDPQVPLNIGLNAYDYGRPWTGTIDEIRLYDRPISVERIQGLADYTKYSEMTESSIMNGSENEEAGGEVGLVAYWPFDTGLQDETSISDDAKMVLPTVSMSYSQDGRFFYSVRDNGEIRIMKADLTSLEEPFVRLRDPETNANQQILGITLDPDFTTNHYVYAYVTAKDNKTGNDVNRVMRFTEFENRATKQEIIIDNIPVPAKGQLFAGALAFGPDEKLYVATGYSKQIESGQNANLTGKVLRINRDGTIPSDNPLPNSPVYTMGHRNIFGIAFDDHGTAVVAENDARYHDEINVLKKGGNYGYPSKQILLRPNSKTVQTDNSSGIPPSRAFFKVITPTQMIFYDNNKFRDLKGMYLVPSFTEGGMYAFSLNQTGHVVKEFAVRIPEIRGHIISIASTPKGEIYLAGENLYRLNSIDSNNNNRLPLAYFIGVDRVNDDLFVNDVSLNLTTKTLSVNLTNNNTDTLDNSSRTSPSIRISIPKVLLGTISDVTTQNINGSSDSAEELVEHFETKETRRITNVGDTIVNIQLRDNFESGMILIKGHSSTLIQSPSRNTEIQR